jgi:O-antigen ligase
MVVLLIRSRRTALWGALVLLLLLAALLLGAIQPQRIPAPIADRFEEIPVYLGLTDLLNQPITDENFAIIERLAHWEAARRMWERAPWLGVGPGNYATIYPEVNLPRWEEALGHAHNIYLNLLAESGLAGLVAYLLLWSSILVWLWRCRRHVGDGRSGIEADPEAWTTALIIGVIGMVCHLSIHNFFDNLFVQGIYLHIALSLATVETVMAGRLNVF